MAFLRGLRQTLFVAILLGSTVLSSLVKSEKPANIIIFLTDDQDERLGSTDYQSVLKNDIIDKGVYFRNHHVTTAVCCPSRATLLKGQFAHNTNITHVRSPG